jgi:hypothetical protein
MMMPSNGWLFNNTSFVRRLVAFYILESLRFLDCRIFAYLDANTKQTHGEASIKETSERRRTTIEIFFQEYGRPI